MEHPAITSLLAALAAEHGALIGFVALLEREQQMLVNGLNDELQKLSGQKSTDAIQLNRLAQARLSILQKNIPQPNFASINTWLETHSQECLIIWQKTLLLAKRAQQLNHANGELIQMKLRHNQQSLAVLSSAVNKANIYGPDGQPNFLPGSGRLLGHG